MPQMPDATPASPSPPVKAVLEKLPYLDGWRGIAISLVLVAHFLPLSNFDDVGVLGVHVFFSLSGLLMSQILFVKRMPLKKFYKRRISRIFPVFGLFVVLTFLIFWLANDQFSLAEFMATITFLRTYLPTSPGIWETNLPIGHLWSLNVEEHCYVFLGLVTLVLASTRRIALFLAMVGMASIAVRLGYARYPSIAPHSGDLGTECVAATLMLSAGYQLIRDKVARFVHPWFPVAAFLAACVCYTPLVPWWSSIIVSPFLLAFSVNHLGQSVRWFQSMLSWGGLRKLGLWSYSLYVWQQPFYIYRSHFPAGLALVCAFVVALLSYYFFESAMRNWLNKHW